jgi:hypothetical protein
VFQFGRLQKITGLQTVYQFAPWLDVTAWAGNRWENETTHDPFDDNNQDKTYGGRVGVTPLGRGQLLNAGLGGSWGPEQDELNGPKRWIVDADVTWSPLPRLTLAAEAVYGEEEQVSFRERGSPIAAPAVAGIHASWVGAYALAHYEALRWLGLTLRYGYFDDRDGWRTGVDQVLQSITVAPVVHLSAFVRDLRPTGATYARTRVPIHWVDLKLEYRLNLSSRRVFGEAQPNHSLHDKASDTSHQIQLQAVVNF